MEIAAMQHIVAKALKQPIIAAYDRDFPSLLACNSYNVFATDYLPEHLFTTVTVLRGKHPHDLAKIPDHHFRDLPRYLAKNGLMQVCCMNLIKLDQLIANYHWQNVTVCGLAFITDIRADLLHIDLSLGLPESQSIVDLTQCQAKKIHVVATTKKTIVTDRPQELISGWSLIDTIRGPFDLTILTYSRHSTNINLSQYIGLRSLRIYATQRVERITISGKGIAVVRVIAGPACTIDGPPGLVIEREESAIES